MSESGFWRFSLRCYALPAVAPACIELQDRCNVDVNVLLFLLFLAEQGRAIDREAVARVDDAVREWREGVVKPLRNARRNLRSPPGSISMEGAEALRANVKRIELEAERLQQETLERSFPAGSTGMAAPSRGAAARANVSAYGAFLGGLPDELLAPLLKAFDAAVN